MAFTRRRLLGLLAGGAGASVFAGNITRAFAQRAQPQRKLDWDTRWFTATDGTKMCYHVMGQGQPLVFVHGGTLHAEDYYATADLLRGRFKSYLLERRNYGISEDGRSPKSYAVEALDVHALLDIAGPSASLFGHSAGALISLRAGLEPPRIAGTVLYEPPLLAAGKRVVPILARFRQECPPPDRACHESIASAFNLITGSPMQQASEVADQFLALDDYKRELILSILETEMTELTTLDPNPEDYRNISKPVTFITGELSAKWPLRASVSALHDVMPSKVITLKGQGHLANLMAPKMLADSLTSALT